MRKILTTALAVLTVVSGLMSGTVAPAEARNRGDVFLRHGGGFHGGGYRGFRGGGFHGDGLAYRHRNWGGGYAYRRHGWGGDYAYRPYRYRHYGWRPYGYRHYGYRYGYPYSSYGYYDDGAAAAGIIGLAAGALVGSALSQRGYGGSGYCASRFRSYDPRSGTYLGYDGRRHPCP